MLTGKELKLYNALAPYANDKGVEIVTVEVVGSKKAPTIRIFIDELDPFPGAYTLEVSSPGIDRPLRTLEHFQRFEGEKAFLQLTAPYEGRARWTGILKGVDDTSVLLEVDGITESLPYEQIKKAHVIGTIDFSA